MRGNKLRKRTKQVEKTGQSKKTMIMCNIPLLLHLKQELVQLLLQLHQLQLVVAI
jgi:hypothetical protein